VGGAGGAGGGTGGGDAMSARHSSLGCQLKQDLLGNQYLDSMRCLVCVQPCTWRTPISVRSASVKQLLHRYLPCQSQLSTTALCGCLLTRYSLQEQFLDGKVLIFHKRRRKNSRRLRGHRQVQPRCQQGAVVQPRCTSCCRADPLLLLPPSCCSCSCCERCVVTTVTAM